MSVTTVKRNFPYIWVTWLSKAMTAPTDCLYPLWMKAQHKEYPKRPDDFDMHAYRQAHERMLVALKEKHEGAGAAVTLEGENDLFVRGRSAIVSGKPDLAADYGDQLFIDDTKGGKRKDEHRAQVWLYRWLGRLANKLSDKRRTVVTRLVYTDEDVVVPADEFTPADAKQAIELLADPKPPEKRPSASSCRFCDVAECTLRVEQPEPAETDAF